MKFFDREEEIGILRDIREKSRSNARFTVVTGRRRVGKTQLIKRALDDEPYLYLYVSRKTERELCAGFQPEMTSVLGIPLFGTAEKFLDFGVVGRHLAFLHLQTAHLAGERYDAYIMARHTLHGHHLSFLHIYAVGQAVEILAVVFETHLHNAKFLACGLAYSCKPVGACNLAATACLGAADRLVGLGAGAASAR